MGDIKEEDDETMISSKGLMKFGYGHGTYDSLRLYGQDKSNPNRYPKDYVHTVSDEDDII